MCSECHNAEIDGTDASVLPCDGATWARVRDNASRREYELTKVLRVLVEKLYDECREDRIDRALAGAMAEAKRVLEYRDGEDVMGTDDGQGYTDVGQIDLTPADRDAAKTICCSCERSGQDYQGPDPAWVESVIADAMRPERARAARMEKALRGLLDIAGQDVQFLPEIQAAHAALREGDYA